MECPNCHNPVLDEVDLHYCIKCNEKLCSDCWNEEEHDEHE